MKCSNLNQSSCLHVADANTERSVSDPATVLPSLPVALLQTNLLWIGHVRHSPTTIALVPMLGAGWFEDGCGLGLGHFVEEGEVRYVFTRWGKGDYRGKLIAPENLIRQVGGANLAGGGGRLNSSTHDHQQLEVCQLWICPASTWWRYMRREEMAYYRGVIKEEADGVKEKWERGRRFKKLSLKVHCRVYIYQQ